MFSPNRRLKTKALGINIYGGGFTLGVMKHFNVEHQLEEITLGKKTFDANFIGIDRPICDYRDWPVLACSVPFVYANPPCAPWSDANTRPGMSKARRFQDPRLALTAHTMEAAMALRPLIFISESVENAFNYGRSHYEPYRDQWMSHGYSVTWFLTDAVIHGAPCRRRRFHFIAHRQELQLPPVPTPSWTTVRTVRDAIGDLNKVPLGSIPEHVEANPGRWLLPRYRKLMKFCEPGGRLFENLPANFDGPKPSMFMYRLRWDRPSKTVLGFDKVIHPDGQRVITLREGMRLLTFPDEYRVGGPLIGVYDTVIPVMAELLAAMAKRTLDAAPVVKPTFQIVDWRPLGKPWHSQRVSNDKRERY